MSEGPAGFRSYFRPAFITRSQSSVPREPSRRYSSYPTSPRPPRPGDDEGNAVEVRLHEVVVLEGRDAAAEEVFGEGLRLRALNLEGGDVGLGDPHVQTGVAGDALRPQDEVGVRGGEPEAVLREA